MTRALRNKKLLAVTLNPLLTCGHVYLITQSQFSVDYMVLSVELELLGLHYGPRV